ncbi:hypothetical protein GJ496_004874 [Pomphorhynchus laevis]|nr:hypothetical protein GJ496_004874 [Pomphorhynchus laevis]
MKSLQNSARILSNAGFCKVAKFDKLFPSSIQRPIDESNNVKRSRLLYQSRKRGNLENCILISEFADKYLASMPDKELDDYDHLLNDVDSDWDLFYWITGERVPPPEFQSQVFKQLKAFVSNRHS